MLINNHILKTLSFPFPLFLSAIGLITTSVICAFIVHVVPRLQHRRDHRVQITLCAQRGLHLFKQRCRFVIRDTQGLRVDGLR